MNIDSISIPNSKLFMSISRMLCYIYWPMDVSNVYYFSISKKKHVYA